MFNKQNTNQDIIIDYAILLAGLAIAGLLIRALHLTQSHIFLATIPMSLGYVVWGVLHHKKHGHIDQKIVMEYVSLAVLINVIIGVLVL